MALKSSDASPGYCKRFLLMQVQGFHCCRGVSEVIEYAIDKYPTAPVVCGCRCTRIGSENRSVASSQGHSAIVETIWNHRADINARELHHKLLFISHHPGHSEIVQMLLDRGADINVNELGPTALHDASYEGYLGIVEMLLDRGADVNVLGWQQRTALHLASAEGHLAIMETLLKRGADVHAKLRGMTALDFARDRSHHAVVELLMINGAKHKRHGRGQLPPSQ